MNRSRALSCRHYRLGKHSPYPATYQALLLTLLLVHSESLSSGISSLSQDCALRDNRRQSERKAPPPKNRELSSAFQSSTGGLCPEAQRRIPLRCEVAEWLDDRRPPLSSSPRRSVGRFTVHGSEGRGRSRSGTNDTSRRRARLVVAGVNRAGLNQRAEPDSIRNVIRSGESC